MNFVELFINNPTNAKLDLDSDINIGLQYSIADIRDISKRNAAYSKTIVLPGTKNNNYWLGNLFDVNADFTSFNPNKKTDAKLLVNSETVIDGFLQLRKINKLANVDQSGNNIQYEVVIYNNAVDLMTELGEKTIDVLDLSEYGHTFSFDNVVDSWTHNYLDGYVYPMYGYWDTAPNDYSVDNFWPSMFYWTLLDRTLQEAGFGWTGSLKTNEQFKKEIIAYVSDGRPKISENERRRRLFNVGTGNATFSMGTFSGGTDDMDDISGATHTPLIDETTPFYDNDDNWNTTTYEWELDVNGAFSGEWKLSGTFSLKNNTGSTVSAVYPALGGFSSNIRQIKYKLSAGVRILKNGTTNDIPWDGFEEYVYIYQLIDFAGNPVRPDELGVGETEIFSFNLNQILPTLQNTTNAQNALGIGDRIWLEIKIERMAGSSGFNNTTSGTYWDGDLEAIIKFNDTSFFKNEAISAELTQGDLIDLAEYLPDKIKQKDLITDLIKRYNLYISVDPDNDRLLIMDPRPDYYDSGETLDWTDKKDFSSEDNIELLSELQFKEMMFRWTQDEDEFNKGYEFATGDTFGQFKYIFDNDFVKGEKEIKSPFSPTPVVYNDLIGAHFPAIDKAAPKIKPRVLLWGGLLNTLNPWQLDFQDITTGLPGQAQYTTYPYAGHFDHPTQPSLDINFGTAKYYFYNNYEYITNNNMYNTYWSNYIRQIEEGRLVTSKFALDETDIRFIKENFNTKIFVDGTYYYVNKIVDYNPLKNDVTTVELLKIVDGVTWEGQIFGENPGATASPTGPVRPSVGPVGPIGDPVGPVRPVRPRKDWGYRNLIGNDGVILSGSNNNLGGSIYKRIDTGWILQCGTWNDDGVWIDDALWIDDPIGDICGGVFKFPNKQLVIGDNNTISSDRSSVYFGDDNIIEGTNISLFNSDNNYIYGSVSNVTLIQATGLTISTSDEIYLGNSFSVDTITGEVTNGGKFNLAYGTADEPSLTWNDDKVAGLWKIDAGESRFHAGVFGLTISTWDTKGFSLNANRLVDYRIPFRNTIISTTLDLSLDEFLIVGGTSTGIVVTLPETFEEGKRYIIKNTNVNPVDVQGATSSQLIDGTYSVSLNYLDSLQIISITNNWLII